MGRPATLAGYLVIAAAMVVAELAGRAGHSTATVSDALAALTRHRAGRLLLLAAWIWLGWHLFVRANWA